jgi:hypothetical protein
LLSVAISWSGTHQSLSQTYLSIHDASISHELLCKQRWPLEKGGEEEDAAPTNSKQCWRYGGRPWKGSPGLVACACRPAFNHFTEKIVQKNARFLFAKSCALSFSHEQETKPAKGNVQAFAR